MLRIIDSRRELKKAEANHHGVTLVIEDIKPYGIPGLILELLIAIKKQLPIEGEEQHIIQLGREIIPHPNLTDTEEYLIMNFRPPLDEQFCEQWFKDKWDHLHITKQPNGWWRVKSCDARM